MNPRTTLLAAGGALALAFSPSLASKATGILPFDIVGFNVGSLTRTASAACGQCHHPQPGVTSVTVAPANRVIDVGASTPIKVSSTSTVISTAGGLCTDVTAGTLVAGATTRTNPAGTALTHQINNSRSWDFSWKAPATAGLAELFVVVNNVNGNNFNDIGDRWAFHGASPTATTSTPVRLYANPVGVKAVGSSCADGFGNFSVLGAPQSPTVGNANFTVEAFGLPPAAPTLFMLSLGNTAPAFDMAPLGAPGCVLQTTLQIQIAIGTGPGDASRAEGSLRLPLPIPNQPALKGFIFRVQLGTIDANSQRAFPFTVTNGLEITLQ